MPYSHGETGSDHQLALLLDPKVHYSRHKSHDLAQFSASQPVSATTILFSFHKNQGLIDETVGLYFLHSLSSSQ
jgi:hypothetical protein